MSQSPRQLLTSTLQALLRPRRSVPIVLLAGPMLAAQYLYKHDVGAVLLGLAMVLGFLATAPAAWRALFPTGVTPLDRPWNLLFYGLLGAVPSALAGGIAGTDLLSETFLTAGVNLAITTGLFWVGGWGLARDIERELELEIAQARAAELELQAERARLLALRAQLDPHFLFNTLNAIAEWTRQDPEVAEAAILRLSALLREVLEGVGPELWPLEREIDLVRGVLELHRIRDPEALILEEDVADLDGLSIPPLILLPLAENAMTHGPRAGHKGRVQLRVSRDPVCVEIDNPGRYSGRRPGGQGLKMVERRLELIYGPDASLEIEARGDRTVARVRLPLQAQPPPEQAR